MLVTLQKIVFLDKTHKPNKLFEHFFLAKNLFDCYGYGNLTIPEDTKYVDFSNSAPMGNTYNPNWQNHKNFNWRSTSRNMNYQRNYPGQLPLIQSH